MNLKFLTRGKNVLLFIRLAPEAFLSWHFFTSREHNHNQLNFPISYFQINAIDAWWKRQRDTTLEWCKLCSGPINRKLSIIRGWNVHRYGVGVCWLGLFKILLYRSDKVAKIGITKDREKINVNDQENKKLEWLFLMWPLSPLKLYCDDWAQKET